MPINGANNVSITLQLTLTSSTTTLILPTGKGGLLSGATPPLRGVIEEYDDAKNVVKREIVSITAISGDQLTIARAVEACPISDSSSVQQQVSQVFATPTKTKISVAMTKGMLDDINNSIDNLASDKLNASGELRTGLTPNRVIITDGAGEEITVGGSAGQVLGFGAGGAPEAVSPTVDIAGLTTASDVGDSDEYLQHNQATGANRKVTGKTLRARSKNFGGTGADGAVNGTSNITISGTNSTYIVRNYSSWSAASGGPKTLTITPTNCILHIKIKGNADFTGWTFDFAGKGGQGAVGSSGNGGGQVIAQNGFGTIGGPRGALTPPPGSISANTIGGFGGSSQREGFNRILNIPTSSAQVVVYNSSPEISALAAAQAGILAVACGSGGCGGRTIFNNYTIGVGGHGGIGVIIEVLGNITFGTMAINNNGIIGTPTTDGFASTPSGGGGGGTVLVIHAGTVTGSPTVNVLGGTATAPAEAGKNGEYALISLDLLH